jgi:uncharacterized protein
MPSADQRRSGHPPTVRSVVPVAFGKGGRTGEALGLLGGDLELGALLVLETPGAPIVAQVQSLELEEHEISDASGDSAGEAGLGVSRSVRGQIALLGRLVGDSFDTTIPTKGVPETPYRRATEAERRVVTAGMAGTDTVFEVGSAIGTAGVPVELRAKGFGRHTFLCGQSGSGKTYATGVLLERLRLATSLPVIVLDPNSDHVHLGEVRSDASATLPVDDYRAISDEVLVARARGAGGHLLAAHFSDLPLAQRSALLRLDAVSDLEEFAQFRAVMGALTAPFSVGDVAAHARGLATAAGERLAQRIDNLGVADWGVWCRPGETSLVDSAPLSHPCVVLDLGSLVLPEERLTVSAAVLQTLWARRGEKRPVLLVVDEAHNVFPAAPSDEMESATNELGTAIAAEGRKYGLHLLVATQRPSRVTSNVVSQCDNLALLRMNSVQDVDELCLLFSHVPSGLIRQAPEFVLGEVLFAGPITTVPSRTAIGSRVSPEGGGDPPADWAAPRSPFRTEGDQE